MSARTEMVERGLYLRQRGVPFDALAYLFGPDAMVWYRAEVALGRPSLVGTPIKCPKKLPEHLLAEEKHTWGDTSATCRPPWPAIAYGERA